MNIKFIIRSFIYLSIVIVVLFMFYIGFLWSAYVDETITSGHAYGFNIGDDKLTTYKKAPGALKNINIFPSISYIEIKSNANSAELLATKPDHRVMVEALLHDVGFSRFKLKNQWDFYFDGSYFNKLSLKFCDGRLCEIYRHRKYFEFP